VVGVQTNCSTSLVAVHLAVQSLLTYDCDAALAGGAALSDPLPVGYRFEEGTLLSPDGKVRSFDEAAGGTVYGNGAGVVLLKRMADALADGDHVWGVILGSAVNNDGAGRARFGTPSVGGQAAVMSYALTVADVDARDVDYVECHGPGTLVGDSVELAALDRAYVGRPARRRVLSSLKPDTGYLDRAAGVAGLIKAVLALHHRVLPATRGFRRPNRAMDTERFEVLEQDRPWPQPDGHPRRAGVGAFGVGGTNAHVIVQEAPPAPERPSEAGEQVLVFSARTASALRTVIEQFAEWLSTADDLVLSDVAHTLQESRSGFAYRAAVVVNDRDEAALALSDPQRLAKVEPVVASGAGVVPAGPRDAADHWLAGADVSFSALHDGHRRRVPLPTYPFERRRHFLDRPDVSAFEALLERRPPAGLPDAPESACN
jgi:acyl transferase domain-containing protein